MSSSLSGGKIVGEWVQILGGGNDPVSTPSNPHLSIVSANIRIK